MAGEGSVYRTPTGWMAQLSIGPRGNRRYVRRRRPTLREAREALAELRAERGGGVTRTRLTVSAYLAQWVRNARNIRDTTRRGYAAVVTYHLIPTLGDRRLIDLTPVDVEQALSVLGERLSPKSLRNAHAVLRRALGSAVRGGLVGRNVASREFVDAPRVPQVEPRALSLDEVRRLLEVVRGDRLEALFVTAIGTGLRQGELLGLAWEDVDLARGRLRVRRELVRRDGRYLRGELKTDRSRRTVPLAPAVVAALDEHRDRLIAAGFTPISTGPVFTNLAGEPLNGSWLTHRFYDLLAAAGIPRLPFKNLRTTFSSRLFEAGVPELTIASLMGHARTATTKRHYIAEAPAAAEEAIERLVG